jgi:hypothetical protein
MADDTENKPLEVIYHPAPGDPKTVEVFDHKFVAGETVEVDPKFRDSIAGHPQFEIKGQKSYGDDARAKAAKDPEDEEEPLSFDEAVTANRLEEYGTADAAEADHLRAVGEATFVRPAPRRRAARPTNEELRARREEEAKARAEDHDAEMADIQQEHAEDEAEGQRRADEIERLQIEARNKQAAAK